MKPSAYTSSPSKSSISNFLGSRSEALTSGFGTWLRSGTLEIGVSIGANRLTKFKPRDASRSRLRYYVFIFVLRNRQRLQFMAEAVAEDINQEDSNDDRDLDPAASTIHTVSRMQDSNDQVSLGEALQQVNTGEHEQDGPLALVLHHSRSLDSSHFEGIPPVPLFQSPQQSVQDNAPVSPRETLDINEDNPVLEDRIIPPPVLTTDQNEDGISSVQQNVQTVINAS
ncbi:hypothetical protein R1sor_023694 [Riccia sorocarpa]|uniref:Uncharacterized protein n=1 Tax=Riccia sorocarpa TaxID=122646 RepID=A0ABD3GP57_9MARC